MATQRVFLTGATGTMGYLGMKEILRDDDVELVILARDSPANRIKLAAFNGRSGVELVWGDLTNYADILTCVKDCDLVLHVGALVSPQADYHPEAAMRVNYGSTCSIISAIKELGQSQRTKLVYIGTVAETGDRMPPIHWGRVGDPIKPSVFDYYAVSKVAAERAVIESELPYWVSLRQTGIMGPAMAAIEDAIMFHNCLDNVLEYASDRDSALLLRNLCAKERAGELNEEFWGHIFNIGGGETCRISAFDMYRQLYGALGITKLSHVLDSKWCATRNFHGTYYLDSDALNDILDFRRDGFDRYFESFVTGLGPIAKVAGLLTKLPNGQQLLGKPMKEQFLALARTEHGTVRFIEEDLADHIAAYWGSREAWEAIPHLDDFVPFDDWDTVVHIDHGWDESKDPATLGLPDLQGAATFRGGTCTSKRMTKGDLTSKLDFRCAFGHSFEASPKLVLWGGHWCPVCERESWNYYERAKVDPFFAQVWEPLHPDDEPGWVWPKEVSELDVVPPATGLKG